MRLESRMKIDHFAQREIGAHIPVQDKEGGRIAGSDLIAEMEDPARGPQRRVLLQISGTSDSILSIFGRN